MTVKAKELKKRQRRLRGIVSREMMVFEKWTWITWFFNLYESTLHLFFRTLHSHNKKKNFILKNWLARKEMRIGFSNSFFQLPSRVTSYNIPQHLDHIDSLASKLFNLLIFNLIGWVSKLRFSLICTSSISRIWLGSCTYFLIWNTWKTFCRFAS